MSIEFYEGTPERHVGRCNRDCENEERGLVARRMLQLEHAEQRRAFLNVFELCLATRHASTRWASQAMVRSSTRRRRCPGYHQQLQWLMKIRQRDAVVYQAALSIIASAKFQSETGPSLKFHPLLHSVVVQFDHWNLHRAAQSFISNVNADAKARFYSVRQPLPSLSWQTGGERSSLPSRTIPLPQHEPRERTHLCHTAHDKN